MKEYEKAKIEIIELDSIDIVTVSNGDTDTPIIED